MLLFKKELNIRHILVTLFALINHTTLINNQYIANEPQSVNQHEIEKYISNLNYDPNQVLLFEGEPVTVLKREGKFEGKNFIVISREVKNLENGLADIGIINNNIHRTYPGSILLANSHLVDNNPDILVVPRKTLKYIVDLPGMTNDGQFEIDPLYSDYQIALNNVINTWFEKYSKIFDVTAAISFEEDLIYSKEQLRVKFGVDVNNLEDSFNIDYNAIANRSQLAMLYKFKQIFYSVRTECPRYASDLFEDSVTIQELIEKNVNERNPPVMVDSVSYGRTIYLKLETTSTSIEAENILKYGKEEFYGELDNLKMMVYILGGGAGNHIELIKVKDMTEVRNIISKYSKFNQTNLGFPLLYSTIFIKDNTRAIVNGICNYVETRREMYESGIIQLEHYGSFIAQFYLNWVEISYDNNGNEVRIHRGWYKNGWSLSCGFSENQELAGNSRNIAVYARECTGLAWEWWRTCIDVTNVPLIRYRKFKFAASTTLNPRVEIWPPLQ